MNKNQAYMAKIYRKQLKEIGKPVNSRFGEPNNLNKSKKDYLKVYKKSQQGGMS